MLETPPADTLAKTVHHCDVEVVYQIRLRDAEMSGVFAGTAPGVHGAQPNYNTAACILEPAYMPARTVRCGDAEVLSPIH